MDEHKTNIAYLPRLNEDLGTQSQAPSKRRKPSESTAERTAKKAERLIQKSEQDIDSSLNRALDAIGLLAKNEIDPVTLIHRISTSENEEIAETLEKAVGWLNRFADQWDRYVQNGFVKSQSIASGNDGGARPGRLYLVGKGNSSGQG